MKLYSLTYVIHTAWLVHDEERVVSQRNVLGKRAEGGWVLGKQMNVLYSDMGSITD